ncbi:hypothetical protein SEA_TRAX_129 [Gordonia phage Trax]|uniref:Uncharacterized protein n=1 Tax=Gordonia phage Trax TaxID=2591121 RepID=A0A515MH73_9CAUD|nr:hypothetical protein L3Y20_gp103 [Gordonia phage Trax]QDM56009.1 hypothetical protein SEA_TRAX_129 [Gordonia phage Trax]
MNPGFMIVNMSDPESRICYSGSRMVGLGLVW